MRAAGPTIVVSRAQLARKQNLRCRCREANSVCDQTAASKRKSTGLGHKAREGGLRAGRKAAAATEAGDRLPHRRGGRCRSKAVGVRAGTGRVCDLVHPGPGIRHCTGTKRGTWPRGVPGCPFTLCRSASDRCSGTATMATAARLASAALSGFVSPLSVADSCEVAEVHLSIGGIIGNIVFHRFRGVYGEGRLCARSAALRLRAVVVAQFYLIVINLVPFWVKVGADRVGTDELAASAALDGASRQDCRWRCCTPACWGRMSAIARRRPRSRLVAAILIR